MYMVHAHTCEICASIELGVGCVEPPSGLIRIRDEDQCQHFSRWTVAQAHITEFTCRRMSQDIRVDNVQLNSWIGCKFQCAAISAQRAGSLQSHVNRKFTPDHPWFVCLCKVKHSNFLPSQLAFGYWQHQKHFYASIVALFPGLCCLQFLITYSPYTWCMKPG